MRSLTHTHVDKSDTLTNTGVIILKLEISFNPHLFSLRYFPFCKAPSEFLLGAAAG